jgi:MFS family permease
MSTSPSLSTTETTWSSNRRRTLTASAVVIASVLFLLYKYILQISPSVMVQPLMAEFHLHGLGIGALTASWFWTLLIFQFIAGPILDRYSAR